MTETTAVLREVDQRHDRSPARCVKAGVATDRATRVRATSLSHSAQWEAAVGTTLTWVAATALRRPTTLVVLAVSEGAWRRWRSGLRRATALAAFGLGFVVIGTLGGELGGVLFGLALASAGWWLRLRAWRASWVGVAYRSDTGDILVTRTHPAFGDEARRLYVDSIRRGAT